MDTGEVANTEAAFPLWTARLSRCLRNERDLRSPVSRAIRPPSSSHRAKADGPQEPKVSMETGWNTMSPDSVSSRYLMTFRASAAFAAEPASKEDCRR